MKNFICWGERKIRDSECVYFPFFFGYLGKTGERKPPPPQLLSSKSSDNLLVFGLR